LPQETKENLNTAEPKQVSGNFWTRLGPGLITGAADDDPSGIATYSQTGAQYGFGLLWLASFTFPLMAVVQEMCARIGMVTGRGLAGNIRLHYSKKVLYACTALLFLANTFNIGADLGAMAKATQLLAPNLSFTLLIIFFTLASLTLQIFTSYKEYAKYLKFLALILFTYVFSAFFVHLNAHELLVNAVIPHLQFNRDEIFLVCAILGTTISPYLFFWQTSQEVEEDILAGKTSIKERQAVTTDGEIKKMRADVWFGMLLSNLVMFCIIAVCAATLFQHGITNIQSAAQAAAALKPIAGRYAFLLFALGIIGTGFLAVPILAGSTSYAMAESFKWREGLYQKFKRAKNFYGIIIVAMGLGLLMNFTGLDPIKALIYSAALNGIIAPVILVLIVSISGDKKIMGSRANGPALSAIGWIVTVLMILVSVATLASLMFPN
jgi:NRAMP (natural resistance-associated macrophage protein)-like metal ion transporter